MERNYKEEMDRNETIKLTIKSLLEVVQTGAKNIEIAIMSADKPIEVSWFVRHLEGKADRYTPDDGRRGD